MEFRALQSLFSAAPAPRADAQVSANPANDLAQAFIDTLNTHENVARAAMMGQADPHALVEALAASQMAMDTVVAMRDRVVEAYQEILRMPV